MLILRVAYEKSPSDSKRDMILWFIIFINFASCKRKTVSKIFDEDFFFIFYDALAEQKIIIMAPTDVITEKYIGFLSLRFYTSNRRYTRSFFYHKKCLHRIGKTHTTPPLHYLNKGDCKHISIEKGDSITTIIN